MAGTKKIKILLTGGGTGGHIYPLIAVAKQLNRLIAEKGFNPDIRYFGDPDVYRSNLEVLGIRISTIVSSKWRRYFDIRNFFDIFKFFLGLVQSFWKIFWFMPHVAFSKGGPGSYAVALACRFYFVPLVIHESDAVAGFANRLAAPHAKIIDISFESAKETLPKNIPMHLVGNPVRENILSIAGDRAAKEEFGFKVDEPVILFLCGSQGAENINEFILNNIAKLAPAFQILHQTGIKNFPGFKQQYDFIKNELSAELQARYKFFPYFEGNLGKAYQAADLVVARAGAGMIFELAALGKPAALIPITESANDHQWHNAVTYSEAGAALVIEEDNLLPAVFLDEVGGLLKDKTQMQKMSEAAKKFYLPDAAQKIADDVLSLLIK